MVLELSVDELKESLRLNGPATGSKRVLQRDITVDGLTIKKVPIFVSPIDHNLGGECIRFIYQYSLQP